MKKLWKNIRNWDIFSKHFWKGVGSVFGLGGDYFHLKRKYRFYRYEDGKTYRYSSTTKNLTEEDWKKLEEDMEQINKDLEKVGEDMKKAMNSMDEILKDKK